MKKKSYKPKMLIIVTGFLSYMIVNIIVSNFGMNLSEPVIKILESIFG